ncbi:hypothetical protein, partial [Escherichia coli]|uniref:hypothetical protein n=1 Tax=Escherichia coli TaxID=562 RepID=UPI00128F31E1
MRKELGERQVQGLDFVYTINGWIKALNTATGDSTKDAGQDAYLLNHKYVAKDIFGYEINYFSNDYKSIDIFNTNNFTNFISLYNG